MPSTKRTCRRALVGLTTLLVVPAGAARALEFTFNPTAGTPQQVIDGFVAAGQRWSAMFDDPVRITIDIDFTSLGNNSLGETVNYYNDLSWTTVRSRLVGDAKSSDDLLAVQSLPSSGGVPVLINRTSNSPHGAGSATPYLDNDGDANNTTLRTSVAIQRALGLSGVASTDAAISFNSGFLWDYDPADGIASNRYDFVGIATHEIGHALGVLSGVDTLDTATTALRDDQYAAVTPMDLFRFSDQSKALGAVDFTADAREKYFSIGDAADVPLAGGVNFGDGSQASHWKDDTNSGIFDPSFAKGELLTISANDRRLLDVLGFDRAAAWSWAKPVSGDWGRALNWASASNLNDATVGARFAAAGAYTVSVNDVRDARSVEVGAGAAVTLQLTSGAARLRVAQEVRVGQNGSLNLSGPARFEARDVVNAGAFTLASGTTLEVSNTFTNVAGVATLAGHQAWRPGSALVVNGGVVNVLTSAAPAGTPHLSVTVNGGNLNLDESQLLNSFTMTAGAATLTPGGDKFLRTSTFSLSPTATLDLNDNVMVVAADAASRDAVLAHVASLIRTARGTDGTWQGTGLTSSSAASNRFTTLAAMINPGFSELNGAPVGPDDVLIKHTWHGDVNFDELINADDYFGIDRGFLVGATGYDNGDLNYDGRINADDYFLVDASFLGQGGVRSSSAFAAASVAIPEPGGAVFLALSAVVGLGRVPRRLR